MYAKLIDGKLTYYKGKEAVWVDGTGFVRVPKDEVERVAALATAGYKPVVEPTYNIITQKLGQYVELADAISHEVLTCSADEIDANVARVRAEIETDIKTTCKYYLDQLTTEYSMTKAIRFQKFRDEIDKGNTSYFNKMAGARMTGAQYVDSVLKPKLDAGEVFADTVIGIETTLLFDLANTGGLDLATFDYKSMWDELDDFQDPPANELDPSWWSALKAKLRIKLW